MVFGFLYFDFIKINMMKKITLSFLMFIAALTWSHAQQDAMFTKYMFNSLAFNPAFAGSPEYMQVRLLYRNQWWGIEGAPTTQTLTMHSPISERVGLGFGLVNDQIGATGTTSGNFSYAYRFGAGVFYYAPKYYVGISVPHLYNNDLRQDVPEAAEVWAKQYRHYYFTAGAALPMKGDAMIFKPSILIKSVGLFGDFTPASSNPTRVGAPTEFDIDASVLFYNTLWVGLSCRGAFEAKAFGGDSSFDSADIWMAYYLANGVRIGASYDYTITKLQEYARGSFELMLGYDFSYQNKKFNTPRYF